MVLCTTSRSLIFASEIKAMHPEIRAELDADACIEYFTFQNIFTDRTLFRHIKPPAIRCVLRVISQRRTAHQQTLLGFQFFLTTAASPMQKRQKS